MNWDILQSYIETLLEMIRCNDINAWEAEKKFDAFVADISKSYDIVQIEKKEKAEK